jgi:antitoxin (DNA-binding transcriptional repressor) of toxin-antitoxin stability system
MKIAGIREFRERTAEFLGGEEPVVVTLHGKVSGLYVPLEAPGRLPEDLRHELIGALGRHFDKLLAAQGVTEQEIQHDFDAYRRRRR